jgi:mono/diheme cytochrome c family protein
VTRSTRWRPVVAALLLVACSWVACSLIACSDSGGGAERPAPARPAAQAARAPAATAAAEAPAPSAPAPASEQLYERGRSVYMGNCTACHGMDPAQPGGLGPAIAGASRELIEARVLHAAYPEGYMPKRDTKLMVALPHLKDDIDALAAYLGGKS